MTERVKPETVGAALKWAVSYLKAHGIEEALVNTELLLAYCLKVKRFELYLEPHKKLSGHIWSVFELLTEKRAERVPLQHLLGNQEFMSLEFKVNASVLIPRQDTEILVEAAINWAKAQTGSLKILDLCTGSGIIAISLAYYLKQGVWAGDISPEALEVAKANALRHGVNVSFRQGDLTAPFRGKRFNLITANPPYIPTKVISTLEPEVAQGEPRAALDGGLDGLEFYRRLAAETPDILAPQGQIMLEIGWDQGPQVEAIFAAAGFVDLGLVKDYAGRNRVLTCKLGERIV